MNILVTGASGFIGSYLCQELLTKHHVFGLYLTNPIENGKIISQTLDIRDKKTLFEFFVSNEINFICHLAYKKGSEMEKTIVQGTANLVEAAREFNIEFLFLSSDLVFSGEIGNYSEEDIPQPKIDYGTFKKEAEELVNGINGYIIRTSLVYDSENPDKMQEFTITSLREKKETPLFTDEFRSPIEVRELVKGIGCIVDDFPKDKIWHIAGPKSTSRFDYGKLLAKHFNFNEELIHPKSAKGTNRPLNTSLNSEKFYRNYFRIRSPQENLT